MLRYIAAVLLCVSTSQAIVTGSPQGSINDTFLSNRTYGGSGFVASKLLNLGTPGAFYNLFLLVNITTNTLNIYPARFVFDVASPIAKVSYTIYLNPVISSSGTVQAITNTYFGGVAASTAPVAQLYYTPSLVSLGTLIGAYSAYGQNSQIVDTNFSSVLAPGSKLLIRASPSAATNATTTLSWVEGQ